MDASVRELVVLLAALVAWLMWERLIPGMLERRLKGRLDDLREELKADADGGLISRDHPAYGILARTIDEFSRSAHRLTIPYLLLFRVWVMPTIPAHWPSLPARLRESSRDLHPDTRVAIDAYRERMNRLVLDHVVRRSPILAALIFLPWLVTLSARYGIDRALAVAQRPHDRIDAAVFVRV